MFLLLPTVGTYAFPYEAQGKSKQLAIGKQESASVPSWKSVKGIQMIGKDWNLETAKSLASKRLHQFGGPQEFFPDHYFLDDEIRGYFLKHRFLDSLRVPSKSQDTFIFVYDTDLDHLDEAVQANDCRLCTTKLSFFEFQKNSSDEWWLTFESITAFHPGRFADVFLKQVGKDQFVIQVVSHYWYVGPTYHTHMVLFKTGADEYDKLFDHTLEYNTPKHFPDDSHRLAWSADFSVKPTSDAGLWDLAFDIHEREFRIVDTPTGIHSQSGTRSREEVDFEQSCQWVYHFDGERYELVKGSKNKQGNYEAHPCSWQRFDAIPSN